jgi:hypothetical protein
MALMKFHTGICRPPIDGCGALDVAAMRRRGP